MKQQPPTSTHAIAPKIYLVGGAVRDFLLKQLGNELNTEQARQTYWQTVEKDWVVVGATPDYMLQRGYRPVGKSFPVFIHPHTQEEYALARTERKTAMGYVGFECYAGSNVTLEDDLKRRDLTINAMAVPQEVLPNFTLQHLIDPYEGYSDLKQQILRHVSPAFCEDPVRILRLARLASRLIDFHVDSATLSMMKEMVKKGEVNALVPERVWQEWCRSLQEAEPWRFFEILNACHAKDCLFPQITNRPLNKLLFKKAVADQQPAIVLFALQLADISLQPLEILLETYRIPSEFRDLALLTARYSDSFFDESLTPTKILSFLEKTDAFRRPDRFHYFLNVCCYLGGNQAAIQKATFYRTIWKTVGKINTQSIAQQGFKGKEFGEELTKLRLAKIAEFYSS